MDKKSSALSGFYKLARGQKIAQVKEFASLSEEQAKLLASNSQLPFEVAERTSENVLALQSLPFSIATNFIVNGREVLVPMCIEEPSVVAAASNGAKLCRETGGFSANADPPVMIGQIQLVGVKDSGKAAEKLNADKEVILRAAEPFAANIAAYGGGLRGFSARAIETKRGEMVIAEFHVDVRDSMGANTVNTILEGIAPEIEKRAGGKARLRILTNLAVLRMARATAIWKKEALALAQGAGGKGGLSGDEVVDGILDAWAFADADIYRASTHNKGIMNGIDAVAVATGNDWRAVEAGAHSYAAISGRYAPLTRYKKLPNGDIQGEIELPLAVGTIGGAIRSLPSAQVALAVLGVKSSGELACIMASVGLSQNFAALRALSGEGIQRGHMELHAKNIAIAAGAKGAQVEEVAGKMVDEKKISASRAGEILSKMKSK